MEVVWQVENDEYCRRVLAQHWPDVARFRDVRDCHGAGACDVADAARTDGETRSADCLGTGTRRGETKVRASSCSGCLGPVDLICGGFPCQLVSHAGKRRGDQDERWLWPEFLRIIREVRPRWALVENVPGLLSIDAGRLFGGILRDLAESGYDAEWDIVSAADVGAPHLRYRLFIVGRRNEMANTERDGLQGAEYEISGEGAASLRRRSADESDGESGWWATEPDVGRVADGVPGRVDRLRALGNAVVPQVAEYVGRRILSVIA